jgi:hypothetical protein
MEMQQLQKAGLSLAQIFRAATISNAREFKLDSQLGTIEPGRIANFVLLKKSPLESVDAYDSITTVWVHGNPISRDSLAVNSGNSICCSGALLLQSEAVRNPSRLARIMVPDHETEACFVIRTYVSGWMVGNLPLPDYGRVARQPAASAKSRFQLPTSDSLLARYQKGLVVSGPGSLLQADAALAHHHTRQ